MQGLLWLLPVIAVQYCNPPSAWFAILFAPASQEVGERNRTNIPGNGQIRINTEKHSYTKGGKGIIPVNRKSANPAQVIC